MSFIIKRLICITKSHNDVDMPNMDKDKMGVRAIKITLFNERVIRVQCQRCGRKSYRKDQTGNFFIVEKW